jgi:hypothetical protein
MHASTGRALGLAAAVAGPLLAAVAIGRQAITIRQLRAKLERDRPSIHAVPAVPPLWRQENGMSAAARFLPQSAATVPPENPHAPPTPPNGVTVRPTAHALRGR